MKMVSTSQARNQFPPARISSVFKNWLPLMTVSASRKKLSSKVTVSIREKNPSPIAGRWIRSKIRSY